MSSLPLSVVDLRSPSNVLSLSEDGGYNEDIVRRHDAVVSIMLSQNYGMKRLKIAHILRLMPHGKFTLIIPPTDYTQPRPSIKPRNDLMHAFWHVILSSASLRQMNALEKIQYVEKEPNEIVILRERKDHFEYNVRVTTSCCLIDYIIHQYSIEES